MSPNSQTIKYQVSPSDLEKCFKFSVEYHLGSVGANYNRTTGQYRGLGGIIGANLIGKLIEIGVARIIEKYTSKKMLLDFEIHPPNNDPDIIKVEEDEAKRDPKLFIEIKNAPAGDKWVGLSQDQFNTTIGNALIGGDKSKAFIVGASLVSNDETLDDDLLGVYLRHKEAGEMFKNFCKIKSLEVVLNYVLNLKDLAEKGIKFNKETSYMYETEVFDLAKKVTSNQIIKAKEEGDENIYKPVPLSGNILPIIMRTNYPKPIEFGEFQYDGNLKLFLKENRASNREYIYCETDVKIKNEALGFFDLKKGKVYECFFGTIGRSPVLKRDNIWIAKRNLANVLPKDKEEVIKEIAENI